MALLRIEHLKKRFGNQVVLDDVNINVDKGQIVCVIGESGGGKSVILKHIIGLIIPDGGRIFLDGREICSPLTTQVQFNKVRKHFGMLFQGAALFDSKNVGENIGFPLREHTEMSDREIEDIITDALEKVGLQPSFTAKMPAELSGGMRSRVGLARALVMKPDVMLYDEPTSALDPIMTDKINDLILSLRDKLGMTSIVVTHDIGSAYKIADRIAMIYQGKIIFEGTPGEIRASHNPYIQQFIRSQRKLHYAVEEETSYQAQVDVRALRSRAMRDRRARAQHMPGADLDPITKLAGKASFIAALDRELAGNPGSTLALVAFAVDSYDRIQLDFGEEFAHRVVAETSKRLEDTIRGTDLAGGLGLGIVGLALTKVDAEFVARGVDRIRRTACDISLTTPRGLEFRPTASCGIALSGEHGTSGDALAAYALAALATAQKQGGDRVYASSPRPV